MKVSVRKSHREPSYSLHLSVAPSVPSSFIRFPLTTSPLGFNKNALNKGILLPLPLFEEINENVSQIAQVEKADVKFKCHTWLPLDLERPSAK